MKKNRHRSIAMTNPYGYEIESYNELKHIMVINEDTITLLCDQCNYEPTMSAKLKVHEI